MSHETLQHGLASIQYRWPRAIGLARAAGAILATWLLVSGVVLAIRRATGATNALEPAGLLAAGLLLAASARLVHWLCTTGGCQAPSDPVAGAGHRCAIAFGLAANGFGLGAMSATWWAGLAFWALMLAEEVWSWKRGSQIGPIKNWGSRGRFGESNAGGRFIRIIETARRKRSAVPASDETQMADGPLTAQADGEIWQRYVRSLTDSGADLVRGTLRVAFLPGARLAVAHVAFCPPFDNRPQFEARQTAGPVARLKISQVLPQGARLEVRLATAAATHARVDVNFTAIESKLP